MLIKNEMSFYILSTVQEDEVEVDEFPVDPDVSYKFVLEQEEVWGESHLAVTFETITGEKTKDDKPCLPP